jgi:tRNA threonylcarbamoyladenosine biosynthesis protein TsaB
MGVAVLDGQKVLAELVTNSQKQHSVRLMPAIAQLLQQLELRLDEIDVLAVTAGPGSYTGVRIGVTTAKTLAWAQKFPLYGVSTLEVLAQNGQYFPGLIVPMLDARRQRAYTAIYQRAADGVTPVLAPCVVAVDELLAQLAERTETVLFLGDDVANFAVQIEAQLGARAVFGHAAANLLSPAQLGQLAWQKWRAGESPVGDDFAPNYLQPTQAEKNLSAKQQSERKRDG